MKQQRERITAVSDKIWEFAEVRYEEAQSAELMAQALEDNGFSGHTKGWRHRYGVCRHPTGSGEPVIAFLGEYDALPSLSQQANCDIFSPVVAAGNGHGCGHNLLGAGALAAALATKACMQELGLAGTVKYFGCPAEEGGGGKAYMARAGLFDGVDIRVHPGTRGTRIWPTTPECLRLTR
ncbi:amidohydrolase [Klebsiella michiganensis]|uniref:Amidohydrolase n=1 Tax=Klebsiella michiganensis TaxID=1134687 RepID=A0A7H4PKL2_9ENTR|nr:amidohydrolase [Klebsiella michiganensis]